MSTHQRRTSPPPITYTARPPIGTQVLTCRRCNRVYPYPQDGGAPIRCECGWWYENKGGMITEEFKPRLGI